MKDLGSRIRCIEPRPSALPLSARSNEQDTLLLCKWRRQRRRGGGTAGVVAGWGCLYWIRFSSLIQRLSGGRDDASRPVSVSDPPRKRGMDGWRGRGAAKPLIRQMGESRFSD